MTILVILAALAAPATGLPCTYLSQSQQSLIQQQDCALLQDGQPVVSGPILADMSFDEATAGLSSLHLQQSWYWVRPDGQTQAVLTIDNGPDPFSQGLTRGPGTNGIAYYDHTLRRVLDTPYRWGLPFQGDTALICADCVASTPDANGYRSMQGTQWGVIDRHGRELVPPSLTQPEATAQQRALQRP